MSKTNKKTKEEVNVMQEVADFANKNDGLLFIVGNPIKDEVYISFAGKQSFMKFPGNKDLTSNVLVRILSESTFKDAMNEFLAGLIKSFGVDEKKGLQLYQAIGGSLQGMLSNKKSKK